MKKGISLVLALTLIFVLAGCNRSMNYIIENEPKVVGIVTEVGDNSILIHGEPMEGYPSAWDCRVSLDVENEDSYTDISVGDEVAVFYDGSIAESDPMQISTVYAITLRTPASRVKNNETVGIARIGNEEIVSASFDSHIPTEIFEIEDFSIVGELLSTLDGAFYKECEKPKGSLSSLCAISVITTENQYYLGVLNNDVFQVSVNGEQAYYHCTNREDFVMKFIELQGDK